MYKPLRWQSQPDAVMLRSVILNSVTEKKQNEVHPGVKSPVLLTLIDTRGEWKIWYYEIGMMKTDSFHFNGLVLKYIIYMFMYSFVCIDQRKLLIGPIV